MMGGALEATHDDRRSTRAALAWLVALGTLIFALVALVVPARAQVRGTIVGPGATSYPIAVSPLKGADGDRFADIVARDLDLSGFFKVIDRGAYIEHEDPVAADAINFENWKTVGALALVTAQRGLNLGGRFSPGGRAIAVALESGGQTDIALLDPSGQLIRWVTRDRALDVSPSWSPDGRSLVFCSDRGGGPQIYAVSADGGEPHRMSYSGNYNTSPSWSPKGDRIAYASRIGRRFQVFVIDAKGGDAKQVTSSPGDNEDPSWSPDGRYLAFSSTRDGLGAIYMSDASGAHQKRLTPPGGDDSNPSWSRWLE